MKSKSPKHKTMHQTMIHLSTSNIHIAAGGFHLQAVTKIPQYDEELKGQTEVFRTSKWRQL